MTVEDTDSGYQQFLRQMRAWDSSEPGVLVGIQEDRGGDEVTEGGATVAQIGAFNEFGTRTSPARPWLRSTMEKNRARYAKELERAVGRGIDGGDLRQELQRLGEVAAADVKATIVSLKEPPNAPSTIARKGSSNPLVDTGRMLGAVGAKVEGV